MNLYHYDTDTTIALETAVSVVLKLCVSSVTLSLGWFALICVCVSWNMVG